MVNGNFGYIFVALKLHSLAETVIFFGLDREKKEKSNFEI